MNAGRVITACLVIGALLQTAAAAERLTYPNAERGSVVDDYHGQSVADPYRWLEATDTPQTAAWLGAEKQLTDGYLSSLPAREALRRRLAALADNAETGVPWREAGRVFWIQSGNQPQGVLYALDKPGATPRVFFDPNQISPDGKIAFGDYQVSPDGKHLAYRAAEGGSDEGRIRVRDLAGDRETSDVIDGYNACWTRDGRGFFYAQSFEQPGEGGSAAKKGMRGRYHRLGDAQSGDAQLVEWGGNASWAYFMVSEDGHYAALVAEGGPANEIFMLDLKKEKSSPFKVMEGLDAIHTPIDWVGDTFFVRTELDASRRRVIALDLREGKSARPREVVAQLADVITDAVIAGDRLVINYLADVHSVLRTFALDGTPQQDIPLPGLGAVAWPLSARPSTPELFYSFESFLAAPTVYAYDARLHTVTTFGKAAATWDAGNYETKQVFYAAKDGTRVPMFITARKSLVLDGSHPVFLTGYGGYGSTMEPGYSADVPLWLEMGGVYVLANIRGGGEYGEEWHRAGMLEKKQTSFDDFIAAAESLVKVGYTSPGRIAIFGHSNGGLLAGAVLTQRPDLFGAVVANAGHYDMLRYHKFTAGARWVSEYGSADDATAFAYLRAYSPLQNVKEGTCYPATLLLAADHDDRVVPSHAYKFAATLQRAQRCDAPVLLRVAENASHSYSSRGEMIAEHADMWSFIAANLGIFP